MKLDPVNVSPLPAGLLVSASRGRRRDTINWELEGLSSFSQVCQFSRAATLAFVCVWSSSSPCPLTYFFVTAGLCDLRHLCSLCRSLYLSRGRPSSKFLSPVHPPLTVKGGQPSACRPDPALCLFRVHPFIKEPFSHWNPKEAKCYPKTVDPILLIKELCYKACTQLLLYF